MRNIEKLRKRVATRHLADAQKLLRAALKADLFDPDDHSDPSHSERWEELLDITERLEDLMGVERGE